MGRIHRNILVLGCLLVLSVSVCQAAPKSKMIDFWNDYESSSGLKIDHSAWQAILDRYLDSNHPSGVNRFAYDQVSEADKASLLAYLTYLQSMDPRQLNRPRSKAFWLNLYNATIVFIVLDSKPKKNIKSLGNIWRKKRLVIARQKVSLDNIQHGVLRPVYSDPRIHFGLTPATIGSGNLPSSAYTGENVEELLERNTRDFFSEGNRGVYFEGTTLIVSSIFKWYKSDFGDTDAEIKSFIKKYVSADLSTKVSQASKISYQYNWELNKP